MIHENSCAELLDDLLLQQQELICGGINMNEDDDSDQLTLTDIEKEKEKEKEKVKIITNFTISQKDINSPIKINLSM